MGASKTNHSEPARKHINNDSKYLLKFILKKTLQLVVPLYKMDKKGACVLIVSFMLKSKLELWMCVSKKILQSKLE